MKGAAEEPKHALEGEGEPVREGVILAVLLDDGVMLGVPPEDRVIEALDVPLGVKLAVRDPLPLTLPVALGDGEGDAPLDSVLVGVTLDD